MSLVQIEEEDVVMALLKKRGWVNVLAFAAVIASCALCTVSDLWKMLFCLLAPVILADFLYQHTGDQCADECEEFDWRNN